MLELVRVRFRSEGAPTTLPVDPTPVVLAADLDYTQTTLLCSELEGPIRKYLSDSQDVVSEVWFSRPELMNDPTMAPDITVDGGATLCDNTQLRFTADIHDRFCHCALCQGEPSWEELVWLI